MSAIQISILAGSSAGKRAIYSETPISFGREAGNTIIVDHPQVSRQHGELHFENGKWRLHNLSDNGTIVRGKTVKNKPITLKEGDSIVVGRTEIMRLSFQDIQAAPADAEAIEEDFEDEEEDENKPKAPVNPFAKRAKLWMGIGIYILFMLVLFTFILPALRDNKTDDRVLKEGLTQKQIELFIRRRVEPKEKDLAKSEQHLQDAMAHYKLIGNDRKEIFRAYEDFRLALAYRQIQSFNAVNPEAQLVFEEVRSALVSKVQRMYQQAHGLYETQRWAESVRAFDELLLFYDDPESMVFKNAEWHRAEAQRRVGR